MNYQKLEIEGLLILEPDFFRDDRGYFVESFNQIKFNNIIGKEIQFVQDNHSKSKKAVLRGLHYQVDPFAQGKLIRVIKGSIFDVAVDLRKNSKSFMNWTGQILSDENNRQFWIPEGFAHGFLTLSEEAEVAYKTTSYYSKEHERVIRYDDPKININWPNMKYILSDKDLVTVN
jgi:dTDP-4-dehydrorhamnose 3,5-epimerase